MLVQVEDVVREAEFVVRAWGLVTQSVWGRGRGVRVGKTDSQSRPRILRPAALSNEDLEKIKTGRGVLLRPLSWPCISNTLLFTLLSTVSVHFFFPPCCFRRWYIWCFPTWVPGQVSIGI